MMALTHCQDHVLSENIWFVWSKTSYSGDKRPCYRGGTTNNNNEQGKIVLLSQWKLEAEFRNTENSEKYSKNLKKKIWKNRKLGEVPLLKFPFSGSVPPAYLASRVQFYSPTKKRSSLNFGEKN